MDGLAMAPSDKDDSEGWRFIEAVQDCKPSEERAPKVHPVAVAIEWGSRVLDLLERIALALERQDSKSYEQWK